MDQEIPGLDGTKGEIPGVDNADGTPGMDDTTTGMDDETTPGVDTPGVEDDVSDTMSEQTWNIRPTQ